MMKKKEKTKMVSKPISSKAFHLKRSLLSSEGVR
jgi:hypothetical protein